MPARAGIVAKAQSLIVWVLLAVFVGFAGVTPVQMDPSLLAPSGYRRGARSSRVSR